MKQPEMILDLEKEIVRNIKKIPQGPISLLLSGGIDSSLVLALIKKVYPEISIHTFTLARNRDYPDLVFAHEVADMFGTDHHEIILSDSEYEDFKKEYEKIKKYNRKGDVNVYILCFIASKFSRTIVTGDGGDECFGGYWLHEHPLGHRETGQINCFEDIHPHPRKHLKEMVRLGFRDFFFKAESEAKDYDAVWEYFMNVMLPNHLEPLLHTSKVLDIDVYTPLFSENLLSFIRNLPSKERIGRKIERDLAAKYLPQPVIERESIGFDLALDKEAIVV
jgi:asparagine synthetase B (glutamine-hydrolysing)